MRVGKPGVKRKDGHFDRERQGEGEEEDRLRGSGEARLIEVVEEERPLARLAPMPDRHVEDREKHQQASGHREEKELHGRVDPASAAPDSDDEVHRNEHDLPEDVEEREIQSDQAPEHPGFEHQKRDRVAPRLLLDVRDREEKRHGGQHDREKDEDERDAVDAERVRDPERRDPRDCFAELEALVQDVEAEPQRERKDGVEDGEAERERHRRPRPRAREEEEQRRPRRRQEDDESEEMT